MQAYNVICKMGTCVKLRSNDKITFHFHKQHMVHVGLDSSIRFHFTPLNKENKTVCIYKNTAVYMGSTRINAGCVIEHYMHDMVFASNIMQFYNNSMYITCIHVTVHFLQILVYVVYSTTLWAWSNMNMLVVNCTSISQQSPYGMHITSTCNYIPLTFLPK